MRFPAWFALVAALATALPAVAANRGGSNFMFHRVDGCEREPYGVLKNYHVAKAEIDDALVTMRATGQERLRIPISHLRGAAGGTNIDSTGGNFHPQYRDNLRDLLATARAAGFVEVVVAFFPQGANNPVNWANASSWNSTHEDYFQENWNLIHNLVPIIQGAGIAYLIDLGNELSPPAGHTPWNHYSWKLWQNFKLVFGRSNTVGFSIPPAASRSQNMRSVYGNEPPHVFDVHLYDDEYNQFRAHDKAMDELGYKVQGWIVGEAFYNDDLAANRISQAAPASARHVHFVTQWPLTRSRSCADVDVVPYFFDNFIRYGY